MFILPAVSGTFLLVNLLCAGIALAVGFGAGVWFFGSRLMPPPPVPPPANPPALKPQSQEAAERALMVSGRLKDLASSVASNVGDHASKMEAISAGLRNVDRESAGASAAVSTALDEILTANAELQQRLEQAEKQIEAQAAEIRVHESEARTDALTGLANRRAFDDELRRRISEWHRKKTPCALILLDVDKFKTFNDTHGHQAGDEVLRDVAKALVSQSRDMDMPCRYGGEEFAVILPATTAADACVVAERIRLAIEASVTRHSGKALKVTASLGLTQTSGEDDAAAMIHRSDEALYKSKESGRNCGHWHNLKACVPIVRREPVPEPKTPQPTAGNASSSSRVASRATFIHELKRRATESHRFGIPLSTMHVKLEGYTYVCHLHGAAVAQQMMDCAAQAIESALRETDVLAQHEHGEFVVMLPGSTEAEAQQMVKRMRLKLANHSVPMATGELPVRFFHSIAQLKQGETAQEMLARARHGALAAEAAQPSVNA